MYIGFNLKLSDHFVGHRKLGERMFKEQKQHMEMVLDKYVNYQTGALVGKIIEEDWFPVQTYDLFISHSHDDEAQFLALAGWLQGTFGLSVFIDSVVWGSADTLLREIDDRFSLSEKDLQYDYQKRNYSTSHVHMLIAMALAKVIDQTECLLFLNTANTLQSTEQTSSQTTTSPWIYMELVLSQLIEKREPKRFFDNRDAILQQRKQLEIEHDVQSPLNKLIMLGEEDLHLWEKSYDETVSQNPLDYLYGKLQGKDDAHLAEI